MDEKTPAGTAQAVFFFKQGDGWNFQNPKVLMSFYFVGPDWFSRLFLMDEDQTPWFFQWVVRIKKGVSWFISLIYVIHVIYSIYQSINLSINQSIYPSIHPSIHPGICKRGLNQFPCDVLFNILSINLLCSPLRTWRRIQISVTHGFFRNFNPKGVCFVCFPLIFSISKRHVKLDPALWGLSFNRTPWKIANMKTSRMASSLSHHEGSEKHWETIQTWQYLAERRFWMILVSFDVAFSCASGAGLQHKTGPCEHLLWQAWKPHWPGLLQFLMNYTFGEILVGIGWGALQFPKKRFLTSKVVNWNSQEVPSETLDIFWNYPLPVTVATRIIPFSVGNPEPKPSLVTIASWGWGGVDHLDIFHLLLQLSILFFFGSICSGSIRSKAPQIEGPEVWKWQCCESISWSIGSLHIFMVSESILGLALSPPFRNSGIWRFSSGSPHWGRFALPEVYTPEI